MRELAGVLDWALLVSGFVQGHPDLRVCKEPRGRLGGLLLQPSLAAQSAGPSFSARKAAGACSDCHSDPGGSLKGRRFS